MKRKFSLLYPLLAAALLLSACHGGAAESAGPAAESQPAETASSQPAAEAEAEPTAEPTPGSEPEAAPAETAGERVYTLDSDFMVTDADPDSGWFVASWLSKGYGTLWLAVNPALDAQIAGEEGAEVVLCTDNVLQFRWRDVSGAPVDAMDMYYYEGDDPQEMTLYAVVYDLAGNAVEEREVLTMAQSADDPYYSTVYPAMEAIINELGGDLGGMEMLTASDEGGDAVVTDAAGNELLRIPGCDASMTYAFSAANGSYVSVYRPDIDKTEIYRFAD